MNLYDAYMTPADRSAARCDVDAALAVMNTASEAPPRPCNHPSLAMVYARLQDFCNTYKPEEALSRGTLFGELDMPLMVGGRK